MKYFIRLYVSLKILINFMFLFLAVEVQIHIKLSYLPHLLIVTFNYNKLPYWLTNFSLRGVIHIKTIPERNDQFLSLYSYLFTNSVICFVTLLFFSVEAICVERVNHIWQFDIFMLQKLIVIYFCYSSSVSWETLFHHQHLSQCAEGKIVSVPSYCKKWDCRRKCSNKFTDSISGCFILKANDKRTTDVSCL